MRKKIKRPDKLILYANGKPIFSQVITAKDYTQLSKLLKQAPRLSSVDFYTYCCENSVDLKIDNYLLTVIFKPEVEFSVELKRYAPI